MAEAASRALDVSWEGENEIGDAVAVTLPEDLRLVLTFGRDPTVLRRAEYRRHMPTLGDVTVSWDWLGWKPDPLLSFVPEGHRIVVEDSIFQEVTYSRFSGPSAKESEVMALFEVPEVTPSREVPAPETRPLPATGEVAPGVHVAEVSGFTVMFVELRDFVVAVEAPETHAPDS